MIVFDRIKKSVLNLKHLDPRWVISDLRLLYTTKIGINLLKLALCTIVIMFLYVYDSHIFNYISDMFSHESVIRSFEYLTILGDGALVLGIAIILAIYPKTRKFARLLFSSALFAAINVRFLKMVLGRPRPSAIEPLFYGPLSGFRYESMPSGHSATIFVLAVVLSFKYPKYGWLFYIIACLVSLSRIIIGMHWPADIVAGAIIGYVSAQHAIKYLMRGARGKDETGESEDLRGPLSSHVQ